MALGFGFRCGFLGLLHMEIVQERLEREYDLDLLATAPSVEYQVLMTDGRRSQSTTRPSCRPQQDRGDPRAVDGRVASSAPTATSAPSWSWSPATAASSGRWSTCSTTADAKQGEGRVLLEYRIPLSEMLVDFYDELKSRTQGYACLDYAFTDYRPAPLVKVDILLNGEPVDALSRLIPR